MSESSLYVALFALLGLLVGSFLNVVIHRLPMMLERHWKQDAQALLAGDAEAPGVEGEVKADRFNLCTPASRCPHCQHQIRWFENIPIVSWLFLRGKCSQCKTGISVRYPLVELANGLLWAYCIHRWGLTATGAAWCFFSSMLLTAALIDWDTTLLPDDLTLPLLWAGLLCSALGWIPVPIKDSLFGAAAGYLSLWSIYWAFKLLTGKEGMGYGDFKLLAALGAWFGWQALIPIALFSSVVGAVIGIGLKVFSSLREGGYMPFGPFLAGAGFLVMWFGTGIIDRLLQP
ncbi:prepilin peptidase [Comamonas odontotermitis]|uniref:prepilin peptidase n=1 Tax=Comamonas odontotermitis TaxID=379895 RepID=UPI001CC67A19|nr:A24 family peptidase [Comamonas odontotermitis]UBB16510.1 A24 family peptidase [Comamonas odontotermitis]